ncbi:putative related to tol protein [Rosellinia necatrix]|uniref:Putative related to tol protein n=1 Tax=Rosellinia necatrix TaxID=77044 RepID=A0A1S7UKF4_ROSNE|nr:putative related to tol protein [Rosellinia necatrix]
MAALCDVCQTIPFRELQEEPDRKIKPVQLGLYDDVKQRASCPFCCLVLQSIQDMGTLAGYPDTDEFRQKECLDSQIEVRWRDCGFNLGVNGFPLRFTAGASPTLGRIVHSTSVVVDPVISLLEDCDASHQCSLHITEEDESQLCFFRAIDVQRMCITPIHLSTPYVTLSYVWGGTATLYLVKDNKDELMTPGGLETYYDQIPLTIRDAIGLVRKMGFKYLWVDALCLVQDDAEDMTIGINGMGIIYEHSYLAVIAANGSDASSGLPGVSPRKVSQVIAEILPGVELVGIRVVGDLLQIAHYSKRAWTFQEFHLSRRKLIFHNNMVYYQCMTKSWSEDIKGLPANSEIKNRALIPTKPNRMFHEFCLIIGEYSIREVTYQRDIVNAMNGVYYKMLGKEYGGHLFGVPIVAFDSFMCFCNEDDHQKFLQRRTGVPSWAWSGWNGELRWANIDDDSEILRWTTNSTWIHWYIPDPAGNLVTIWDLPQNGKNNSVTPTTRFPSRRTDGWRRFSTDPLPTSPTRTVPHAIERPYGLLQFWTFSACFNIRVDAVGEERVKSLEFVNWKVTQQVFGLDDNEYYGCIQVDEELSRRDHDAAELIVVSEAAKPLSPDHGAFYNNGHWSKLVGQGKGCWYNVLYVEGQSGLVERKGFGQIHCDAIQVSPESPWKWKEMIMG